MSTRTALVVVISGPSGVGKDAIIERMAQMGHDHHFTVTVTTRQPRPGECEGVNHFFVTPERFTEMVANNELLEWAQVYGNFYGVPRDQVRRALAAGKHVLLRVDVQGAARLRTVLPEALFIFILPPSMLVLRRRLEQRGVNTTESLEMRLKAAETEIEQAALFDYEVVNCDGTLDETVARVTGIIEREAARTPPRRIVV